MNSPVALIIFNRPDHTREVFKRIAEIKPKQLFIVADGPRDEEDERKCLAARKVVERITWDCEVAKNYSEKNMGCKQRVATGINWVFENVEQAIILEDDCVPHPDFFRFCDELLIKYENDKRIMQINGSNFQLGCRYGDHSYYFWQMIDNPSNIFINPGLFKKVSVCK